MHGVGDLCYLGHELSRKLCMLEHGIEVTCHCTPFLIRTVNLLSRHFDLAISQTAVQTEVDYNQEFLTTPFSRVNR